MNESLELAEGLQHSNVVEVAQICKAFLELKKKYDQLELKNISLKQEIEYCNLALDNYDLLYRLED